MLSGSEASRFLLAETEFFGRVYPEYLSKRLKMTVAS